MKRFTTTTLAFMAMSLVVLTTLPAMAQQDAKPVAWDTFTRAETDKYLKSYVDLGGFGKFLHSRKPTPIDAQTVIRMQMDTLYSFGVFDLSSPLTITIPDTGDRFISMMVINQDHYMPVPVAYKPGKHTLTQEKIGTRYVFVGFRTLANANDPQDIKKANAIQDQIKVEQASVGKFEAANWDEKSLDRLRDAINVLAATLTDASMCFGAKDEVDPIAHLLGTAFGWGGNPAKDATYLNITPQKNDGKTPHTLTVKDVPVDAFWSISLYNGKGFFQENEHNAYMVNSLTGVQGADGSFTIHFGGDPKQPNYLAIMDGWNYIVRLYKPRQEILDGSWAFSAAQPVK